MNSIVSVVGARPQFIKAAVVSRALAAAGLQERLIHTGQHYDSNMSAVFFDELGIPAPAVNLAVGSGSHATQTGQIMVRFEESLLSGPLPDCVLVYGDTNSTLAAAVAARKLLVPVAHVEAGLRSANWRMPEEINRIVTDRVADMLFCPTESAVRHLAAEGIRHGVHLTGDVMYDATRFFASRTPSSGDVVPEGPFCLATVHRPENTDDPERLAGIIEGLGRLGGHVVFLVHPRTQKRLSGMALPENIRRWEPQSYLSTLRLVKHAEKVFTDSGGLQKESVWLETPCVTLRDETEWEETLKGEWNIVAGTDPASIERAAGTIPSGPAPRVGVIDGGTASERIASILSRS